MAVQFHPVAQLRVSDATVYAQIKADYGLTDEHVNPGVTWVDLDGVSPQTLMTRYSIPAATAYSTVPGMLFGDSSLILGTLPPITADGDNTLGGQDYTDPNGQHFTSVTYAWRVAIEKFVPGAFTQQIVTWNGDGTVNRLIPTAADISVGSSAVWIFGNGGSPVLCTSTMLVGLKHATYSVDPASTTAGVMSMGATGFRVTDGTGVDVNRLGFSYVAVVWNDTNGTVMSTGTYTGNWNGVAPKNVSQGVITTLTAPVTIALVTGGAQSGVPDGVLFFNDYASGIGVNISTAEAFPLSGVIQQGAGGFTVGAGNPLNTDGHTYYYVAFALTATDPIRLTMLTPWTTIGTAGADTVTGLNFTPGFAIARTFEYPSFGAAWRGPADVGTASHGTISGGGLASGGIESFGLGTLGLGTVVSPSSVTVYGLALAGGTPTPVTTLPLTTWVHTATIDNGNGTTSTIETCVVAETPPDTTYVSAGLNPTFHWWCNATFGWSVYQIDSPGAGWVSCSGPATSNGWYLSTAAFGNQDTIVSGGRPADPRPWTKLATWCGIGNMAVYGGSPAAGCNIDNHMLYPASGYTVGTDYPPIRIFDGRSDKELCKLPPTTANVIPKAVMSMLAANGTVYLTTWDSGTTSADWNGRVMQLDPETGILLPLGTKFADGELPYALCWHMGRLWCGTNNGIGTVGKVYYFRPGIDTAWTQDYATATSSAGGVTAMASYKGQLYVGTDNAAASRGKVLVRDTAGAYTTSQTGTGGTAKVNNGYLALTVLGDNLYASYWNNDTTPISKIEKYTGSAWTTAYTGVSTTLCPFILLQLDNAEIYAVGGSPPYDAVLLVTANGTTWTDLTAQLPSETATLLPMFGAVVT